MRNQTLTRLRAVLLLGSLALAVPSLAGALGLYVDDNPAQRGDFVEDPPGVGTFTPSPTGIGAFGWEPANIAAAMAAGLTVGPSGLFFDDLTGQRIMTETLNNPITPDSRPPSPSKANPVRATAEFLFTALDQDYRDLSIILIGRSPTDPTGSFYTPGNLGIDIDPSDGWGLVQPDPTGFPDLFYLTLEIGDLLQGESTQIDIDYRVAQTLLLVDSGPPPTFELPQLWIGFMETVPEAGGVWWLVPVVVSTLSFRRR